MTTIDAVHAGPGRRATSLSMPADVPADRMTADRVSVAWAGAPSTTRAGLLLASALSLALDTVSPAPATVRWSIAAVGVLLAVAAMVDVHEHKLPNRLLAAALAVALGGAIATSDRSVIASALAGLALAAGPMLLVRVVRGVGMGDVKMAGVIGVSAGSVVPVAAPAAIAIAAFVGGAYGLVTGRRRVALGPALWLGWALSLTLVATGWLT